MQNTTRLRVLHTTNFRLILPESLWHSGCMDRRPETHSSPRLRCSRLGNGDWNLQGLLDAAFFMSVGAILWYGFLVASGQVYKGKPDLIDRLQWRILEFGQVA